MFFSESAPDRFLDRGSESFLGETLSERVAVAIIKATCWELLFVLGVGLIIGAALGFCLGRLL